MHPFRAAVEAGDLDAATALLADAVVFNSPAVFRPYEGKAIVSVVLRAAFATLEGLTYEQELADLTGHQHALVFRAQVGDRLVHGCDFLRTDADGRIVEFTVMIRPLSALQAVAAAMGQRLSPAS